MIKLNLQIIIVQCGSIGWFMQKRGSDRMVMIYIRVFWQSVWGNNKRDSWW